MRSSRHFVELEERLEDIEPLLNGVPLMQHLLVLLVLFVAACGVDQPQTHQLKIIVSGKRAAIEKFTLSVPGLSLEPETWFANNRYERRLSGPLTMDEQITLTARHSGDVMGSVDIKLNCVDSLDFKEYSPKGWRTEERHRVILNDDGTFVYDTRVDETIFWGCSMTSPDGKDGVSGSSPVYPIKCDGETDLRVVKNGIEYVAALCTSYYKPKHEWVSISFTVRNNGHQEAINITTCMNESTPLPSDFVYPSLTPQWCPYGISFKKFPEPISDPESLEAVRGNWSWLSADMGGLGRIVGNLDELVFREADGTEITVRGKVDLPLVVIGRK